MAADDFTVELELLIFAEGSLGWFLPCRTEEKIMVVCCPFTRDQTAREGAILARLS